LAHLPFLRLRRRRPHIRLARQTSQNAPAAATCDISLAGLWAQLKANLEALAAQEAATESRRHAAATPAPVLMTQASADNNRRHVAASPTLVLAAEEAANECRHNVTAAPSLVLAAQVSADESRQDGAAAPASALVGQALADKHPPQMVCRRVRPRRRTGRRNCPRAPSPFDEALPSPQPTGGGTSPSALAVPTLLAQGSAGANSPHRLERTASSYPSPQPSDVRTAVTMLSDGGDLSLPPRKHARGRHHPRRVCRCHGPRAPNLLEPLLCGRRHRPRAPIECGGWA
jgi:hypothetical protein